MQPAVLGGLILLGLSTVARLSSQAGEPTVREPLSLDRIFDSGEFNPASFGAYQWREKRPGYVRFEQPAEDRPGRDLVWHDPETDETEVLVPGHLLIPPGSSSPLPVDAFEFSQDESKLLLYTNSKRVWRVPSRGDYWVLDRGARTLRQLGGGAPPSSLMFATFSPDGSRVCYVHDHNLYVQHVGTMEITPLTGDGSETLINGTFDWVYEEEFRLRKGFRWSPDGRAIAYWQVNTEGVPRFPLVNNTADLYPQITSFAYPKVGEQNAAVRIGVVPAAGGATTWLQVPGDSRNHYLARMDWAKNSEEIILQQFNRLQNTNRLMIAQARSGDVKTILTETDAAWVEDQNPLWWFEEGGQFIWLSERDGWNHAYRVDRNGGKLAPLTQGDFDVIAIEAVAAETGQLYFMAAPGHPTQRYLYSVGLQGDKPRRLTPEDQPGTHDYDIAPDGHWAIHTYSTFSRPPVTELVRLPDHKVMRVLADNSALEQKLEALDRPEAELFRVEIEEGVELDGWCLKPPGFDAAKTYPVLVYVYGEPAGQTVLDRWGGRSELWHWMLAQQGYVVLSLDNRGTPAPRGRAWRRSIYRQVGILASADQAAALRALLRERPYLDPRRVAIWGWSGGGSMSLNMIFRHPDLYGTAMAVAPVPNQRYYDTIYQERYMGLPGDNVEGYRLGSPIHFAHQLQGNLLVVHGTGDDNCHYQGVEALVDELILHHKPFTMMAYPNRSHSISEGPNTTRHLYALLTRYLLEHTPPGGRKKEIE